MSTSNTPLRTIELFAGVGGFHLGLNKCNKDEECIYEVVWSNQWEPSTKKQHASEVYQACFPGTKHTNEDIAKVIEEDFEQIPEHDLLVGGFPCQDYSVARTLSKAEGLRGKKGVLWWSIYDILDKKGKKAPSYLMLENVDRLLKSPAKQRGRDFAIMLSSLNELGYIVEWRVINAADYGMPQRRRRVYIMAYKKGTGIYKNIKKFKDPSEWLSGDGVMNRAFPMKLEKDIKEPFVIKGDLADISENHEDYNPKKSPFDTVGIMIDGKSYSAKGIPQYNEDEALHDTHYKTLGDVLVDDKEVPEEFYLKGDMEKWEYMKGSKKEERTTSAGYTYCYSEGAMVFPDALDNASRTIVTGEGGSTPSRFKHVVKTKKGLRRLTPVELERLNMFPDNHTNKLDCTAAKRAFFMGNALVVGIVEGLGKSLKEKIDLLK
ncbi:DNA (cytosine-5-)-methyltransferase [Sulfurovum sp. XTW-4]|uniref:Cytosine-specific methyltransferase n=1 Tax=Sulfurovum xiamenensis TaxID=3019066 RepID=A0ABT7QU11_9BACT|nr:DNA (cytosine-5-)-methyltransferase [Sulfurovum xiamenensis]MDM5264573.1 DNA (cytosine-5-)-methyltransferase [Sulfurovum xiamenensis]